MPSQEVLAEQYRVSQAALSATVTKDVLALWLAGFRPGSPDMWGPLLGLLRAVVFARHSAAAGLAAVYYGRARVAAGAATSFAPVLASAPPVEQIDVTAGITGPGAYKRSLRAGRTVEQARRSASVQLAGAMTRLVANGGRDTIRDAVESDEAAIGWARVTSAKPCAFCAMLAGRGPTYRSQRKAAFQAHDHCACVAAAVFSPDEAWLGHSRDLAERWQEVTAGASGAGARRAWRRYWDNREAGERAG